MTEITDAPISKGLVEKQPPVKLFDAVTHGAVLGSASYEKIHARVNATLEKTIKQYPNVPPDRVKLIFSTYFGPLMHERREHFSTKNEYEKEMSARYAHHFAHGMFYATTYDASPEYSKNMYELVRSLTEFSSLTQVGKGSKLEAYLAGLKSETAIMGAFLRSGRYEKVLIPDYTQNPDKVSDKDREVLQWDILSGVDFVAISEQERCAVIVDSKSRSKDFDQSTLESIKVVGTSVDGFLLRNLNENVRDAIAQYDVDKIYRVTIYVPSKYIGARVLPKQPNIDYRTDLTEAISLPGEMEVDMINKLDEIRRKEGENTPIAA